MERTWVTDLATFADLGDPVSQPTRRLAEFFGGIVSSATATAPGEPFESPIRCRRRPRRRTCAGYVVVLRTEVPGYIAWRCPQCEDNGVIRNWRGTRWDQRRACRARAAEAAEEASEAAVVLTEAQFRLLREVVIPREPGAGPLVYSARRHRTGVALRGSTAQLEFLLRVVGLAARAERRRHLRRALDCIALRLGERIR